MAYSKNARVYWKSFSIVSRTMFLPVVCHCCRLSSIGWRTWHLCKYSQRDFLCLFSAASHDLSCSQQFFFFSLFSFFILSRPRGQKSQVLASCAGWPISRSGISRLLLVWPTVVRSLSSSVVLSESRSLFVSGKAPTLAGGKNDRLYLLDNMYSRRTRRVS